MRAARPLLAVALVAALAGCGSSKADDAAAAPTSATVTIQTFAFAPDPLTVKAGTTIHVVNRDKIHHSVTAGTRSAPTPAVFDHVLDGQGSTYDLTLSEPGTYRYFCKFHEGPGMTATIVVERP